MSKVLGTYRGIGDWITAYVADLLGTEIKGLDRDSTLFELGLTSLDGVTLAARIGVWLDKEVSPTLIWDHPTIEQIARALSPTPEDGPSIDREIDTSVFGHDDLAEDELVAVIGLGCRFAGALDPEAYWHLISAGGEAIIEIPPDRWDVDAFFSEDVNAPGKMASRWGGFLPDLDQFDASFFNLTPREANALDPRQRLSLEVAWEALEDAGIPSGSLAGSSTGVFMSALGSNFGDTLFTHHLLAVDAYAGSGNGNAVIANRLSHFFDLRGPSVTLDTACSGSLVSIHLACRAISGGECDVALAGGVNVILRPDDSVFFSKTGALAPDGRCKPFDRKGNGIVRSEGAGVVVLKRFTHALRDGDRVYAVVRGSAMNHSGATNGIMAPSALAQASLVKRACEVARVRPAEVQYVEAHGTGTAVGDPIEANTLGAVLGEGRTAGAKLRIGSVKGNIGHAEAAAGVAGFIKAVLSIDRREIPPSRNFDEPNPLIHFDDYPIEVQQRLAPWPDPEKPLVAGVSSFGFSGANAHIVLAEAPSSPAVRSAPGARDGPVLLPISARSDAALCNLAARYADVIRDDRDLVHVAAGAALHRDHLEKRCVVVADHSEEARQMLNAISDGGGVAASAYSGNPLRAPRTVFVFSGQGSAWVGMGQDLLRTEPLFRRVIEECDRILEPLAGWSLLTELGAEPAASRLKKTEVMQPAIFSMQVGLAALLQSWGLRPDAVVGQSLGEVAAAHVSGGLNLEDAMKVVFHRSRLMARTAGAGATAFIGLAVGEARDLIRDDCVIAGQSSPGGCIVAGSPAAIDALVNRLDKDGKFARRIENGDVAFHSAQMDPLVPELEEALATLEPRTPRIPVFTALDGGPVGEGAFGPGDWARNLRQPFDLPAALTAIADAGPAILIEVSPSPVLQSPLAECLGQRPAPVAATLKMGTPALRCLTETLAQVHVWGGKVDWTAQFPEGAQHQHLPKMPWIRQRFWHDQLPHAQIPSGFDDRTGRPWVGSLTGGGHPLLGEGVKLAGRPGEHIWTGKISTASLPWLADHRVGEEVLLPLAAIVEMALACGQETNCATTVAQLVVEEPLRLPEDSILQIQAVLRPLPEGEFIWELHSLIDGDQTRHAHARLVVEGSSVSPLLDLNPLGCEVTGHYDAMAADGLSYGPAFRGLRSAWQSAERVLARLELPAQATATGFLAHPAIVDAGLQATRHIGVGEKEDVPRLPVGVRTVWLSDDAGEDIAWCEVTATAIAAAEETQEVDLRIADAEGRVLLTLEGLALAPVGRDARKVRPEDTWFGREWREVPHRHVGASAMLPGPTEADFRIALKERILGLGSEHDVHHHAQIWPWLDRLCTAYILRAVSVLQPDMEIGLCRSAEDIAAALGVVPTQHAFFERLLDILTEDGCLDKTDGVWRISAGSEQMDPDALLEALLQDVPAADTEAALIALAGEALPDMLTGDRDPVDVLFGGDGGRLVTALYQDTPIMRVNNAVLAEIVAASSGAETTRILEVGAGTGASSSHILDRLPRAGIEYNLTDLSAQLVEQTGQRFEDDPRADARVLDLDRDPAAQGFSVGQYDVIVAANALHATEDVQQTLSRLRSLLAPGGVLTFIEGNGPQRWLDLTFGATMGWWRLRDGLVRTSNPLIEANTWRDLLEAEGFKHIDIYTDDTPRPSQIVAVARREQRKETPRRLLCVGHCPPVIRTVAAQYERMGRRVAICENPSELGAELDMSEGVDLDIIYTDAMVLGPGVPDDTGLVELDQALARFLGFVKALARANSDARRHLWLVTRGAESVAETGGEHAVAQAALAGMLRALFVEQPELAGAALDIDPQGAEAQMVHSILREFENPDGNEQIAYRDGRRFAARLGRQALPPTQAMVVGPDDCWLVTGGISGIGLAAAQWLADRGCRRLVLAVRTALPPRGQWSAPELDPKTAERIAAVRDLEARGAAVRVLAADMGDPDKIRAALSQLADEGWPDICGVVHSAGLIDDHLMLDMDEDTLFGVSAPKIQGSATLHHALPALRKFVLFSSGASLIGGTMGQANYVAANAFLDALAQYRHSQGQHVTCINWGMWGESGIVARSGLSAQLPRIGLLPIPPEKGIEGLSRAVTSGTPQTGIVYVDWARWRAAFPALAARPYFSEIMEELDSAASVTAAEAIDLSEFSEEERDASRETIIAKLVSRVIQQDIDSNQLDAPLNQLGLDSIMAVELKHQIEAAFGIAPSVVDLLRGASVRSIAGEDGSGRDASKVEQDITIERRGGRVRRASSLQKVFWSTAQRAPTSPIYNLPFACFMSRRLDASRVLHALRKLTERHAVLRTSLALENGELSQVVADEITDLNISVVDLDGLEPDQAKKALGCELDRWARRPIPMNSAPLMHAAVFQVENRSVCFLALHHAIVDGWSVRIFIDELDKLISGGSELEAPSEAGAEFADLVEWQAEQLEDGAFAAQEEYWRARLAQPAPPLFDNPLKPTSERGYPGRQQPVSLAAETVVALDRLCQDIGTTLSTVLLAGYCATLHAAFDSGTVCVGLGRSNRTHRESHNVLGCFVNTLPILAQVSPELPFGQFVESVHETVMDAFANGDLPLDQIARTIQTPGDKFALQTAYVFKVTPKWLPETVERIEQICSGTAKVEVGLDLTRDGDRVFGFFEYDTGRLSQPEAEELADLFETIVQAAARNPEFRLAELLNGALDNPSLQFELEKI